MAQGKVKANSEPKTHSSSPETNHSQLIIEQEHPSLRVDEGVVERLVRTVLEAEERPLQYLGIILADHDTVLDLNRTYLQHDYLTDVLSFPLSEGDEEAVDGEIYVDLDTAAERHAEFDVSFEEEVCRYVVHGLLHLLGYDDATPQQRAAMQRREDRYLRGRA